MTTIVMNTLNGAVTEYDWQFQSITPRYLGDATGLYEQGGDDDDGAAIAAQVATGKSQFGTPLIKRVDEVFFSMTGDSPATLVLDVAAVYTYPFVVSDTGVSRGLPARGLRQNYMALGFRNSAGGDFRIDKIEAVITQSDNRRLGS